MDGKEQRLYNITDAHLIIQAEVFRDYYSTYQEHFRGFNQVIFHENYIEVFQQEIDSASNLSSDEFVVSGQMKETQQTKVAAKELLSQLECLAFIIKLAFVGRAEVLKELRIKELKETAKRVDAFIIYASDMLVKVAKYRNDLEPFGLEERHITAVTEALADLDAQRRQQVAVIQERPVLTQNRIGEMNTIWKRMTALRDAAQHIFADQPVIKELFTLPKKVKREHHQKKNAV